jgi:hypothetical protein
MSAVKKLPVPLQRRLARKAVENHRSVSGEIVHRLERSLEADAAEEQLAAHLRRALASERTPMKANDVLEWAEETFDQLERAARQK